MQIFSFPLNLILALLWVGGIFWLWRTRKKSIIVNILISKGSTIWAIVLFLIFSLVIGITGKRELAQSWLYIIIMLYFQTVLLLVIFRGWRAKTVTGAALGPVRWRFILNHLGLFIAISSAFWGYPDSETLRLKAIKDIPVREAYHMDGTAVWLPYEITLKEFRTETYENGVPSKYQADLQIDQDMVKIEVNDPYSKGFGQDIYLVSYDASENAGYCIIEIVDEPWKYGAVAGIIMMLAGAFLLFIGGPGIKGEDI